MFKHYSGIGQLMTTDACVPQISHFQNRMWVLWECRSSFRFGGNVLRTWQGPDCPHEWKWGAKIPAPSTHKASKTDHFLMVRGSITLESDLRLLLMAVLLFSLECIRKAEQPKLETWDAGSQGLTLPLIGGGGMNPPPPLPGCDPFSSWDLSAPIIPTNDLWVGAIAIYYILYTVFILQRVRSRTLS